MTSNSKDVHWARKSWLKVLFADFFKTKTLLNDRHIRQIILSEEDMAAVTSFNFDLIAVVQRALYINTKSHWFCHYVRNLKEIKGPHVVKKKGPHCTAKTKCI